MLAQSETERKECWQGISLLLGLLRPQCSLSLQGRVYTLQQLQLINNNRTRLTVPYYLYFDYTHKTPGVGHTRTRTDEELITCSIYNHSTYLHNPSCSPYTLLLLMWLELTLMVKHNFLLTEFLRGKKQYFHLLVIMANASYSTYGTKAFVKSIY